MKKLITLLAILLAIPNFEAQAQRYLSEVFSDVSVEKDIVYARNISVLTGTLESQDLVLDFYEPIGDTIDNRPLVILLHTGNFLPIQLNGTTSGIKEDFPIVEIAMRLAKMGYAVAAVEYRLGWNPFSSIRETKVSTLINAIYRGVQDVRSCIRFFRKDAIDGENQFGICSQRIVCWGIGTGGYIATAAAVDDYDEMIVPKFIDSSGVAMIQEAIHGDPFGTSVGLIPGAPSGADTLSLPNHVGYNHDIQLAVNMGRAIADTSWIDADDPPFLCFHVPDAPFIPYVEDILVIPTSGELIMAVQGSYLIAKIANDLGLNDKMNAAGISDAYTVAAALNNNGLEGLFPLLRPIWEDPFEPTNPPHSEASPWDWWDSTFWSMKSHPTCTALGLPISECNFDVIMRINNRDASEEKGKRYIDSIMGYYAPRAYAQLDLWATYCATTNTEEVLSLEQVNLKVAPNPSSGAMVFTSKEEHPIKQMEIYNLAGQMINSHVVNASQFQLDRDYLQSGMYIAKVKFANGLLAQKIVFE